MEYPSSDALVSNELSTSLKSSCCGSWHGWYTETSASLRLPFIVLPFLSMFGNLSLRLMNLPPNVPLMSVVIGGGALAAFHAL